MQEPEQKPHSEASRLGRFITKLRKKEAHQLSGPGRGNYLCLRGTRQSEGSSPGSLPSTANAACKVRSSCDELGGPVAPGCWPGGGRVATRATHGRVAPHGAARLAAATTADANNRCKQKCISIFNKLDIYVN